MLMRENSAADATGHDGPEPHRELRDLVDGGTAVAREEGVKLLLHDEAEGRKHGHAAVGQLGLAVAVDLELVLALEEARRVELADRAGGAGEAERERLGRGRLRGGLPVDTPRTC